ncbi:MAG: ParB/RepB/Spo0J family partition protein [Phycisphaerae bacterium]|nr:ParB/RepB/Spo0J family partition protein [Phycisphaerae bacterium]
MSADLDPKRRLGRGLSSLIDETPIPAANPAAAPQAPAAQADPTGTPREIPVDDIAPNPYQPRRTFNETELAELAQSISLQGILQPLIITDAAGVDNIDNIKKPFALIAGERRLRAAKQAGLATVPCIIREANQQQMIEWAVIENIQRADLNPIDRGQAYRDYMDKFSVSQQEVAERLGQARGTVANYLRMLDLCDETQEMVAVGQISFGHAKVLAGLAGAENQARQVKLARKIVSDGLSVRKLEELVTKEPGKVDPAAAKSATGKPAYVRDVEQQLTEAVGTRVTILPGRAKNTGKIVVEYYSLDDFDRISGSLGLEAASD